MAGRWFLTGNIGNPHLEKVVAVVTALMNRADWDSFMRHFNRNFRPHLPEQMDLFKEIEAKEARKAAN